MARTPGKAINSLARADPSVRALIERQNMPDEREVTGTVVMNPDDVGALDDADDDVLGELGRVLGELDTSAAGANVKIWRIDPRNPKETSFIDEIQPQEFSLKWLADTYGGGRYRVRVYVPQRDIDGNPTHMLKLAANKTLVIDGLPRVRREPDTPNVPAPVANDAALVALAGGIKEGFTQLAQMIATQQKPPSMVELLQQMAMIKQVFGASDRPALDPMQVMQQTLAMVKSIDELRALRGGDDDGDSGGGGASAVIFGRLFDMFAKQFEQLPKDPAPAAPSIPLAVPVPDPAAPPAANVIPIERDVTPEAASAPATTAEDDEMGLQEIMLRGAMLDVLKHAERNTPVDEYAAAIFDQAPDVLFEFLDRDDWFETLKAANARAALFPVWLTALRNKLLEMDAAADDETGA